MMKNNLISTSFLLFFSLMVIAQELPQYERLDREYAPLELARLVADNVVDKTVFQNEFVMQRPFTDIEYLDFASSLNPRRASVAYALTVFRSEIDQRETIEIGRTGCVKVWVNDKLVYDARGDKELPIEFWEKYYVMPEKFEIDLKKGDNKVLIKTSYNGNGPWRVFLQSVNLGYYAARGERIRPTLSVYAPKAENANWLMLGCFDNTDGKAMDINLGPETDPGLYRVHSSGSEHFQWNLPRVNLNIAHKDGGKFYSWSYHTGSFMWALQCLSRATGEPKYNNFASSWCDYHLSLLPIVEYQTRTLQAVRSMNWGMSFRPMLDYTSAPSMPYMARLVYETDFASRDAFKEWAEKIMRYLSGEQFRLPDGVFAREYTITPSVWADDMFMGIPYLLFSAQYTKDETYRKRLLDDAANQVIQFNKHLYRSGAQLYMQACYAGDREEKIPFWSRGNGWAIWGTSEVLLYLPKNHRQYKQVLEIYRKHIDGIVRTQDSDGYWHNILDMPETVREASGAAMFVLNIARGINQGWLDRKKYAPALDKGWKALQSFVGKDGNLYGIKGGTNFSPDPADYARTPFVPSDTHGLLPLVFACIEMDQYLKKK